MLAGILIPLLGLSAALSVDEPEWGEAAYDLASFEAQILNLEEGEVIRFVLHEWHKQPGLISARCSAVSCVLEVRLTDGYGTYDQGSLSFQDSVPMAHSDFDRLANELRDRGFWELSETRGESVREIVDENGERRIALCMHAPHYFLQARIEGERRSVARYCQDNYSDAYVAGAHLLEIAAREFPEQFASASHLTDDDIRDLLDTDTPRRDGD